MRKEDYEQMKRLLDSLTKGAGTLREVFQKKEVKNEETGEITFVPTDEAKAHPMFSLRMPLMQDKLLDELSRLMTECDWPSNKAQASELHSRMCSFISATPDMPKGIGKYEEVRNKCNEWLEYMVCEYPELSPKHTQETIPDKQDKRKENGATQEEKEQFINALLAHPSYQAEISKPDGLFSSPFTLKASTTITRLARWLAHEEIVPTIDSRELSPRYRWSIVDGVFTKNGQLISNNQLKSNYNTWLYKHR